MLFNVVAEAFAKIEAISSRLEMTDILAGLFAQATPEDARMISYLLQSRIAPTFDGKEIGFGEKLVMEGIAKATGYSRQEVEKVFNKTGDLGITAETFSNKKAQHALQTSPLTLEKVFSNLQKMSESEGTGSQELKKKVLAELINSGSPVEARFIARIPVSMRLGVGDPTIMDSLAVMLLGKSTSDETSRPERVAIKEKIESAYNIHSDLGDISYIIKKNGLEGLDEIKITAGIPIRAAAAERLENAGEILKKMGGVCAVESKYDGFRLQISKNKDFIKIFSRHNEEITKMFPELVEAANKYLPSVCVVEGEAIAFDEATQEYYPFQITIQRKRKHDVGKKSVEYPLKLFLFEVVMLDGKNLISMPFSERRKKLESLIKPNDTILLSEMKIVKTEKELSDFFEEKISQGLEGIMAKDLNAKYTAGARKFAWIKLKRSVKGELKDTIDAVVIGYYSGKGKRTEFGLGALLVAAYNSEKDSFESLAKIGTGMKEIDLSELEEELSKMRVKKKPARVDSSIEPDFWVEPRMVVELNADEITKSPSHECAKSIKGFGLALRFPRLLKKRMDKKAEDSTTNIEIAGMFDRQKRVLLQEPVEE